MEGYVFALMANSGTDPELEAEDELEEIRKRELELRYLVKLDESGQATETNTTAEKLAKVDEQLMSESSIVDHYSPCWPPGERAPAPPPYPLKSTTPAPSQEQAGPSSTRGMLSFVESLSDDEPGDEQVMVSSAGLPESTPCYLIKLVKGNVRSSQSRWLEKTQRNRLRPACYQSSSTASSYSLLPPLKLAFPGFRHSPLPVGLQLQQRKETKGKRSVALDREKIAAVHQACSKVPSHPTEGLLFQSWDVLKKHYDAVTGPCFLTTLEK